MRTKHFTRILLLAFIASLSVESVHSQTEETQPKNSLQEGMWALQFQINSNFTLGSFQGMIFSAKRHFSSNSAIRFGVSASLNSRTAEQSTSNETQTTRRSESDNNGQSVSLLSQYIVYPNPEDVVNIFFGGGPTVSFYRNYRDSKDIPSVEYLATEFSSFGIGANAAFGVEWFAARHFSLHAEYGIFFMYYSGTATDETRLVAGDKVIRKEETKEKTWRFDGNSVRFGLSVYL